MTTSVRIPGGLSGEELAANLESGLRPAVLLLHGMMGGAWQFQWFQRSLAEAGFRSLAINYRGHHDSRPVDSLGRVGVQAYLEDALAACHYLGQSPVVVGQSMGGLIGQMVAECGAARAVVMVVSLPPRGVVWRSRRGLRYGLRYLPSALFDRSMPPNEQEQKDRLLNAFPPEAQDEMFARQVPESGRAARQIALGQIAVDPSMVTCPVLSVTAGADRLVLPSVGTKLAKRYRGDLLHFDTAGHYALVGEPGWQTRSEMVIHWINAKVEAKEESR
jgi:pimeloyl-ACP methyl ester carboxylesterase